MLSQKEYNTLEAKALKTILANKDLLGASAIPMKTLRIKAGISTTLLPEIIYSLLNKNFITISTHDSYTHFANGKVKTTNLVWITDAGINQL